MNAPLDEERAAYLGRREAVLRLLENEGFDVLPRETGATAVVLCE
ncbi:hypothetical protein [Myxococcus dinghuensis]|nr:hypothetical protein [Myxococcus dinghuensis]